MAREKKSSRVNHQRAATAVLKFWFIAGRKESVFGEVYITTHAVCHSSVTPSAIISNYTVEIAFYSFYLLPIAPLIGRQSEAADNGDAFQIQSFVPF